MGPYINENVNKIAKIFGIDWFDLTEKQVEDIVSVLSEVYDTGYADGYEQDKEYNEDDF